MKKLILFFIFSYFNISTLIAQQKFIGSKYLVDLKDDGKLKEKFKKYKIAEFNISAIKNHIKTKHKLYDGVTFNMEIEGENIEFRLFENDIFDSNYKLKLNNEIAKSKIGDITTFAGYTNNNPENVLRLYVSNDILQGYFTTEKGKYNIGPIDSFRDEKDKKNDYNKLIIYSQDDEISNNQDMICGNYFEKQLIQGSNNLNKGAKVGVDNNCKVLRIAIETDNEFCSVYSNNILVMGANIADWFNRAEEVYVRYFKLRLKITSIHYNTATPDVFGDSQNSLNYVFDQFRNYWIANNSSVTRNVAYLLTGKGVTPGPQNTSGYGYADINSVCTPNNISTSLAYAFSTIRKNVGQSIISTDDIYRNICHELGHTVGAVDISSCTATVCNIMTAQLGKTKYFDGSSVTSISNYLNSISCLTSATSQNYASLFSLKLDGVAFTPVSPYKIIASGPHTLSVIVTNSNQYSLYTDFTTTNTNLSIYNKTITGASFQSLGATTFGINIYSYLGPSNIASYACYYDSWFPAFKLSGSPRINAFPNPSSDFLTIENSQDNETENISFEILNENGDLIEENNLNKNNIIDIRNLKNGIYFLHLHDRNNLKVIKRIVVKH